MSNILRIGTRDSQLAVWQATWVQRLLAARGIKSELVYIKSEGDIDTVTPLYALGVQGVFTKTLDAALLNNRIDIAVHSMKDVPTQLAAGIRQAAVLERASTADILVYKDDSALSGLGFEDGQWKQPSGEPALIATSSIRRIAQWKHRYPTHIFTNLRGNVNTRLSKLQHSSWTGAIFAAAGVERIGVRPEKSINLNWMLPAPAQGAVVIVCRADDNDSYEACRPLNHEETDICTFAERQFLSTLMGGCSTPISALATVKHNMLTLHGNVTAVDGSEKYEVKKTVPVGESADAGQWAGEELLQSGAKGIIETIRNKVNEWSGSGS